MGRGSFVVEHKTLESLGPSLSASGLDSEAKPTKRTSSAKAARPVSMTRKGPAIGTLNSGAGGGVLSRAPRIASLLGKA